MKFVYWSPRLSLREELPETYERSPMPSDGTCGIKYQESYSFRRHLGRVSLVAGQHQALPRYGQENRCFWVRRGLGNGKKTKICWKAQEEKVDEAEATGNQYLLKRKTHQLLSGWFDECVGKSHFQENPAGYCDEGFDMFNKFMRIQCVN
ncbi:hypothetical protein RRG08_045495 [Elysia crispata]|uniref:Uncharacterized protein n=1 Tax=Elysia crispata TaxID=231223 RepID=A0AAE1ADV9_9GAST|nr:hypothetical protein RRG08_045495 [Elysia crispata]